MALFFRIAPVISVLIPYNACSDTGDISTAVDFMSTRGGGGGGGAYSSFCLKTIFVGQNETKTKVQITLPL